MFEKVEPAPPDAILGVTAAFNADPRDHKVNLGVGVYRDEDNRTPIFAAVKEAERRITATERTKVYWPIPGPAEAGPMLRTLYLGDALEATWGERAYTCVTPGGTGALRVTADFLSHNLPKGSVWVSDPTWANHHGVLIHAGLSPRTYPYLDRETNALAFDRLLKGLASASAGDAVILHGCCHNPTGVDPTVEQWHELARVMADRKLLPIIDLAYQGLGDGLEQDAASVRIIAEQCAEFVVCSSYSKNFGLYRERVGAASFFGSEPHVVDAAATQVNQAVRRMYSNPPAHGMEIVMEILQDQSLRADWEQELTTMRERIHGLRAALRSALDERDVTLSPRGNAFITEQRGMFTLTGLSKQCVETLKDRHAIYAVGSGRINVAGMRMADIQRVADALADVIGNR